MKPFLPDAAAKLYAGFNYPTPFSNAGYNDAARRPKQTEDLRVTAPLTADGKVTPMFPKIDLKSEPVAGKK